MPNDAASPTTDLHFLTIAEAAGLIARRQLSPVALTRAFLDRIASIDPQLNAYLLVTAEQALDQARTAEVEIMAGHYRGPMHGIPFALKDIYCTAGIRTTSHSRTRADYRPGFRCHHRREAASGRCNPAR
jgi:aspartyl-tRNA(Asn)/glutamyl-tRNA(Gln) amidotransferase subunit A